MSIEKQVKRFAGDEVYFWLEQESSIHLKAVSGTDPVELTATEARKIGAALIETADKLDKVDSQRQQNNSLLTQHEPTVRKSK
ncbi:MAG: hypothetical protein ACXWDN_17185 [Limisphaerales bacterium]